AVRRRRPGVDDRPGHDGRRVDSHRGARGPGGHARRGGARRRLARERAHRAGGLRGRQPGFRRHAGAPGHRADHRARHLRGLVGRAARGAGGGGAMKGAVNGAMKGTMKGTMKGGYRSEDLARRAIVEAALRMNALGINSGRAGNVSMRWHRGGEDGLLITPSALAWESTTIDDLVWLPVA